MLLVIDEATELIAHYQSATAYNILALAYKKIGNYEQAKTIYERLLVHNSENTLFLGNLGILYMDLGSLDKAEKCFLKCLAVEKKNFNVSISLASVFQSKSKLMKR